jgi:acyl-homoserine-lactone acylase
MFRVFKRVALGLVALILVTAIALALWEPLVAEEVRAPGPRAYDVEIVRDDFGVPHIFGKTDPDVSYGIAYAHAEDDFATLQEVAAMTRARLGAMTGQDGAKIDFAAHLLDIRGTVDRKYPALPADIRALLDAYAAGLNHYADKHPEEVRLTGLFPLNGQDIAAGFALRSPFFFGLDAVLGALVEGKDLPIEGGPKLTGDVENRVTPIGPEPDLNGSNAFAVAPARSTDNVTRLVSNSHQPWRGGVAWYELVVHSEEGWDFAGATFPGSPYPFLGHNKTLGWTNTVNRPDLIDVYKLVLNDDRTQYLLDGEWRDLEAERVWLKVRIGPFTVPYPQTIYRAAHGPVIVNAKGAFAIRYAGIDELNMLEQYFRINKARNFDEWQAAMAIQGVPATNFIYADAAGTIAMSYNALFPARKPGPDWRGVLPGDRSDLIWQAHLPWDRVPMLVNPASGYIMNANNTPYVAAGPGDELDPADYSPLMGIESDMTNRARQAIKLFEAAGQIDAATLERIKYDVGYDKSDYATQWMAALLAVKPDGDNRIALAQALLRAWDWQLDGKGKGDALALMVMRPAMRQSYRRLPLPNAREVLIETIEHLDKHFASLDPKLGTVLRLRQGSVDLPMHGGSDTLRAATLWDVDEKDGRLAVRHGDSFIQFVEWDAEGNVASRSIQPFGAATTRPESPHYTDQAKLFVEHKTKPVYFTREQLMPHAKRRYRP